MISSLWRRYYFILLATALMWIKTYIVYQTSFNIKIENGVQSFILFINPISFFLFVFGIGLFMKEKVRNTYIIIMTAILTTVLIANMTFYKFYNDFLTIPVLSQSSNMADLGSSIQELFNPLQFILFVDIFILIWVIKKTKDINVVITNKNRALYFVFVGAFMMFNLGLAENERPQLLTRSFDREMLVKNIGIYNFHLYDAFLQTRTSTQRAFADSNELVEIENYIKANKLSPNEKMFGIAEGRNVIFVSLESTQSFVVNETLFGQEITPFLNQFIGESLYFENFYHQTEQGKTSDSEFLVANSLYPLGRGAVFFTHSNNEYDTIQRILKREKDYQSFTFHANNASFWNRDVIYTSFGTDKFYDIKSYEVTEDNSVGWGLKDKEYFEQSVEIMKELSEPFYSYLITLTNHFPFDLNEADKLIDEFDSNSRTLNRYFPTVRYQDEALKHFIESLKESGLYENSIIVLMGDHYGISENHNKAMAKFLEIDEVTPYHSVQLQRVPLLIHMPGITDKKPEVISTISGQIDVKPTLLHLLGIETKEQIHFGNDLFSEERLPFTVLRNGNFITEDYIYASGICYERSSGVQIEDDACAKYQEKAHTELAYSDKILYGDLLRFYSKE